MFLNGKENALLALKYALLMAELAQHAAEVAFRCRAVNVSRPPPELPPFDATSLPLPFQAQVSAARLLVGASSCFYAQARHSQIVWDYALVRVSTFGIFWFIVEEYCVGIGTISLGAYLA